MTKKEFEEFWGRLKAENPQVYSRAIGKVIRDNSDTSHELEAEKINAIKQKTSKGYRILDINPNLLDRSDYFCVYDDFVLRDLFGNENLNESVSTKYDNEGSPVPGQPTQVPYFRTLQVPVEGTWLKVEFLPCRKNFARNSDFNLETVLTPTVEPQNTLEQNNTFDDVAPLSGEDIILLEFENPQGKPHVVRNGDVFRTYFTNLILTVKQNSPRIRVTVGFNSEIESTETRPETLHIWKGHGIARESFLTPRPFLISDREANSTSTKGVAIAKTAGSQTNHVLVTNINGSFPGLGGTFPLGLHIGWITGFRGIFYSESFGVGDLYGLDADLMIAKVDPNLGTVTSVLEKVCSLPFISQWTAGDSTVKENTYVGEPIRYQLRTGEALILRTSIIYGKVGAPDLWLKFSVNGYAFGTMKSASVSGLYTPFEPGFLFTENAYPGDLDRYLAPRA